MRAAPRKGTLVQWLTRVCACMCATEYVEATNDNVVLNSEKEMQAAKDELMVCVRDHTHAHTHIDTYSLKPVGWQFLFSFSCLSCPPCWSTPTRA